MESGQLRFVGHRAAVIAVLALNGREPSANLGQGLDGAESVSMRLQVSTIRPLYLFLKPLDCCLVVHHATSLNSSTNRFHS